MHHNTDSSPIEIIKKVLSTQFFAVLSSVGKDGPYSSLIAFAATDDLLYLVFVTSQSTRKYRNIIENNRVSLLIDNRSNRPADINEAIAITVIGSAHKEIDREKGFHSIFLGKHPNLKQFVDHSESVLVAVSVFEYLVARFETTQRVLIKP